MTAADTKITPKKRAAFLEVLSQTGNVSAAANAAGLPRRHVYIWRDKDDDFRDEWNTALEHAADLLELEARRRAYQGVRRLKFDRGKPIMVPELDADGNMIVDEHGDPSMVPYIEQEYSDTLLIFLLKGALPEKYRERVDNRHSGQLNIGQLSDDELRAIIESKG